MVKRSYSEKDFDSQEWAARVDLAACFRLVDHYGMTDLVYNHISLRVPGKENEFLINPLGVLYSEITASSLLKVDIDGKVLFNPWEEYSISQAGYVIHSAIHGARPDAHCIIHTHTLDGVAVSTLKCGLLPITQTAMRFREVAYHDYEGVALSMDERARLVDDLGSADVMILRNHGLLAVGMNVQEAFNNIYRLERACVMQIKAMSCNTELIVPAEQIVSLTNEQLSVQTCAVGAHNRTPYGVMEWPALIRMLEKKDASYRS